MLTLLAVATDAQSYAREDRAHDTVLAHVSWQGALGGEVLTASLVRLDGYGPLATQTATVATAGAGFAEFWFPLEACLDGGGVYRARSGRYAVDAGDGQSTARSAEFLVSLISAGQLRNGLLAGIPLLSSETVAPRQQPAIVTGVTIEEMSQEHFRGLFPLAFDHTAQTLQWGDGAPVSIAGLAWNQSVFLFDRNAQNMVRVRVRPNLLPAASQTEGILIDRRGVSDEDLVRDVWRAESYVQRKLWLRLEPTTLATSHVREANPNTFYDGEITALPWRGAREGLPGVMHLSLPAVWVDAVHELHGYFNDSRVLTIGPDWIDLTWRNGLVTLIPNLGASLAWVFYGGFNLAFMLNYPRIPNFWQYSLTCGAHDLRDDRAVILELVEKRAAVETLIRAGLLTKPGYRAESLARDGVASSVTYGSEPGGAYSQFIAQWQGWIDEQLGQGKLRNALVGVKMETLG